MIASLLLLMGVAAADPSESLTGYAGHPWTIGPGHAVFGLFRPATFGFDDRVDLTVPGLATPIAPRVDMKLQVWEGRDSAFAVQGGVGVPTAALALLRSTATVLSTDPGQRVQPGAIVDVGVIGGLRNGPVMSSVGVEVRGGVITGELEPQGVWWLDPMLAPMTEGPVVRMRWITDYAPTARINLTGELIHQVGSGGHDTSLRGLALLAPSKVTAFGVGWAFARETFESGVDTFGMPLLDVQGRF